MILPKARKELPKTIRGNSIRRPLQAGMVPFSMSHIGEMGQVTKYWDSIQKDVSLIMGNNYIWTELDSI